MSDTGAETSRRNQTDGPREGLEQLRTRRARQPTDVATPVEALHRIARASENEFIQPRSASASCLGPSPLARRQGAHRLPLIIGVEDRERRRRHAGFPVALDVIATLFR